MHWDGPWQDNNMPKISACIISYNEEARIEACLKSLLPVADEIVVVDSLSTDRTREIAAKYTEQVFEQAFLGHVEQKNFAVQKASHDWILSLDCDERLDATLTQSILEVKNRLDEAAAWRMARKTFYIYRWLNHCWYPDIKTRLFNRKLAKWGGINPHDHVEVTQGSVKTLRGDILHYSFNSISDHLRTIDNFTEIGADEIIKRGKSVSVLAPFTHGFWTFFRSLVIKRGFMDGFAGLVVSVLSGVHAFVKYSKVIMKRRTGTSVDVRE
jgi:glycosyltransferase involved in cell wall biosynthesis